MDEQTLKQFVLYDENTGVFERLIGTGKGASVGTKTKGCLDVSNGYRKISINGKQYYAHRLAWLYMTGKWPLDQIDHVNEIRDDNRFENLREANNAQNNQRSKARSDSKTKVLGVFWHKKAKKYVAQIRNLNQTIYLGLYETIEMASSARKKAELELNFVRKSM